MKTLKDILIGINTIQILGNAEVNISGIQYDSRALQSGDVFFAVKGTSTDGHHFISMAVQKGAKVIICETIPDQAGPDVTYVKVADSAFALGVASSNYYDSPSGNLKLVGVTGTNGKTTTATLLYRMFRLLGYKAGLLSTVCNQINDIEYEATHTTPDPIQLNRFLSDMVQKGCEYCFMEVSSHALDQKRIAGLQYAGAIFSNLTHDHLDYHKTFDHYLKSKKLLFDHLPKEAFALVNIDDKNGRVMLQNCQAHKKTYAMHSMADFKVKVVESHMNSTLINIDNTEVWVKLIGEFNAYNLLAIYGAAILLQQDKEEIVKIISDLKEVRGRFETIHSTNNITAIVDYAHTPDALMNVLKTINQIRTGNEKLITVVGAGGNRDKTKRPVMAKITAENSDKVILTSDNPRFEEPEDILRDMEAGISAEMRKKTLTIVNRKEAIRTACMLSKPGDIILVAGKGHETYQEIKGIKNHFDDKEILTQLLTQ